MNVSKKTMLNLALSPLLISPSYASTAVSSLPNIVVIFADDFGYGDLSCYGAEKINTPEVDSLASEGIRFTNGYVASSLCSPSRYSLLTGRYSWRTHLKSGVLKTFAPPLIESGRLTLPEMLKQNGYYTACVGKWHLGFDWALLENAPADAEESVFNAWGVEPHHHIDFHKPVRSGPVERGFDYFFGIAGANNMMPFVYLENDKVVEPPSIPNNFGTNVLRAANWDLKTLDQTFTHKAVEVINDHFSHHADKPMFLYFPTSAIHRPCLPTFTKGKSQAGTRGDMVLEFDWMVGQIVNALKENDAFNNTLIIITSDNGPQPGDPYNLIQRFKTRAMGDDYDYYEPYFSEFSPEYPGNGGIEAGWLTYGHNPTAGLMGFKSDAWEGGLRVPFIIHWPDKIKQGRVDDNVICTVDIMATIAELLDVDLQPETAEDSYSFLANLLNEDANPYRNTLTMVSGRTGALVIRQGDWKYLDGVDMTTWDQSQTYNPNEYPGAPDFRKPQLYNLKTDVFEKNDLYMQMPEKVMELQGIIEKIKSGTIKENR